MLKKYLIFVIILISVSTASTVTMAEDEIVVTRAIRAGIAPKIDGRLDDKVWKEATWFDSLMQQRPEFGSAPSVPTAFAVAFDADTLYFAARCHTSEDAPLVSRLTRRDRDGDFDLVTLTLAPRFDGRTGYTFQVNPHGVQRDIAWHDDGQADTSWDAVWRSGTEISKTDWTVEMAIPFDQLRFQPGQERWGFQVTRWISAKQESVAFRPVHPKKSGWISNVGALEGTEEIVPGLPLTVTPETYFSYRTSTSDYGGRGDDGFDYGVGGYAKVGVAPDWVVDLAFNPDFGQVEVDQVVLNLTAYETQFPEKRPFFLESAGLFQTPIELFYSRRLGAPPPGPDLLDTEEARGGPTGTPIISAVKLTGRNSNGLSVGALNAVLLPTQFEVVDEEAGTTGFRQSTPWTNAAVLRLTAEPAKNIMLGALGTALNPDESDGSYAAGGDWTLHSCDRKYAFRGQVVGSFREDNVLGKETARGAGVWTQLAREGGETFRVWTEYAYYSPDFDVNDLGYLMRNDLHKYGAELQLRRQKPLGPFLEIYTGVHPKGEVNTDGLDLGQRTEIYLNTKLKGNWWISGGAYGMLARYDDMETRGGPPLRLPRKIGWWGGLNSPEQKMLGFNMGASTATRPFGYGLAAWAGVTLRLDRLELNLSSGYERWQGDLSYVDTVNEEREGEDITVVGRRDLDQLNTQLKGTFVITRNLTFQASGQLLTVATDYSRYRQLLDDSSLDVYDYSDQDADFASTDLSLQALLRYEYLPGSTIYAVYTHSGFVGTTGSNPLFLEHIRYLRNEARQQLFMIKLSHMFG